MRYRIRLSYNGSTLNGWQKQVNAPSVQQELSRALSVLLQEDTEVTGAGRTDAKVNAINYIAHFDTAHQIPLDATDFIYKINAILPRCITVHQISPCRDDFHARFSATSREYHYFIHRCKDPFAESFSYLCRYPLDLDLMNRAAASLLGTHDFSCFEKTGSAATSPLCEVTAAGWSCWTPAIAPMPVVQPLPFAAPAAGDAPVSGTVPAEATAGAPDTAPLYLVFTVTANRFLRNMVRAIVGTLVEVGRGRHEPEWVLDVLASRDRCRAGQSVPGHALFLTRVHYPDDVFRY